MRRQRFPVMLSVRERQALQAIADTEGLSGSAVVRRLIRKEACARSLWALPGSEGCGPADKEIGGET